MREEINITIFKIYGKIAKWYRLKSEYKFKLIHKKHNSENIQRVKAVKSKRVKGVIDVKSQVI